ncbi:type II toxin-antitoxin system Phd/YefM family antitoxin [Actinomyces sp.]|uniref:type II toxin-antitoxin system Phd/YefM family antitoxin n=1 Tax=Actinomyces sp. TaxID=29317 RepID=UPI0026DC3C8C|nr:type II toxin-antitoxin system prevent-host-death family antitoxin [Actinomyces sp.]MDO4901575.1 type II toxin-antitoxin system prevent-host-death family antitoxin [Actinomyces sp.]
MSVQVSVAEAEAHLSELLDRVEAGEEITVARGGRPVATLRAVAPQERRTFGVRPDLKVPDEFFFAPLTAGRG